MQGDAGGNGKFLVVSYLAGYNTKMNVIPKTVLTTDVFDQWFDSLRDKIGKKRIQARIRHAELGNLGDCEAVGEGVSEMRIHYGPGYRLYFIQRGLEIIIVLAGGDKSTQSRDIELAKEIARDVRGENDGQD